MNKISDKIHDPLYQWGRLIFPWLRRDKEGKIRWLAYFSPHGASQKIGIKLTDKLGFHNCRIHGG